MSRVLVHPLRVRYAECDPQGVVFNSRYLEYFDVALTELWREIARCAAPGARVIFRTAADERLLPGRIPDEILGAWTYHEAKSKALNARDRSSLYGGFHLYTKDAPA